jgi:hypothetical protein
MLFVTEADKEAPGEVVEGRRDVEASGVGVNRKIVGEEVVTAEETDSKYLVLMQSQRKRASQRMIDSHNPNIVCPPSPRNQVRLCFEKRGFPARYTILIISLQENN